MSEPTSEQKHRSTRWRILSRALASLFLIIMLLFASTFFGHGEIRGVSLFQPGKGAAIIVLGFAVAVPLWCAGRVGWLLFSLIGIAWFSWFTIPAAVHVPAAVP